MNKKWLIVLLIVLISLPLYSLTFGAYVGSDTGNTLPPPQEFRNRMIYWGHTQVHYHYNRPYYYDDQNDAWVDSEDIAFTCSHGNQWMWVCNDNNVMYLKYVDDNDADLGLGDYNERIKWMILYSCLVVASPLTESTWWGPFVDPDGSGKEEGDVFDGLHMFIGFRTNSWVSPAVSVTRAFVDGINTGGYLLDEWFDAIDTYGYPDTTANDKGSVVYHPNHRYDTLSSTGSFPASNHSSLNIIYHNSSGTGTNSASH